MPTFYWKSTCSTCRKARSFLQSLGVPFAERDMSKEPLTEAEVRAVVGEREIRPFLNTRTEMYRDRGMKANPPSKDEALALMAENPNLIRRPLLLVGDEVIYGWDEEAYRRTLAPEPREG